MPIPILMPALSPTMEEGNLASWLVAEGDTVEAGDVIAEIETDKATMEVEAVDEGTIGKILIPAGTEGVKVNAPIAVLLEDSEDASALEGFSADAPVAPAASPAPATSEPAPASAPSAPASPAQATAPASPSGNRIFASPLARRIAAQGGIDLGAVSGSGPKGRIVKKDVDAAIAGGGAKAAPAAAPAAPATAAAPALSDAKIAAMFEAGSYDVKPHDKMRKIIGARLLEAKQTVPHFYLNRDVALDELLKARKKINDNAPKDRDGKPKYKVSVNDFIIKALAMALQAVPDANATWTDEAMLLHAHSDVAVAVAIPGGLVTPIIRKAETKGLATISGEMKDYAARARERKLMPEEYTGGSTAVSNLGMFGIDSFSAIINPPQATILAVGAGTQRAVVRDGAVSIATMMTATLSCDHRAVDGALGALLLDAFKGFIEDPMSMLV